MKDVSCKERSSSKFHINERGLESYYNMFSEVFVYALFIMFIYVSPCMFVTIDI